MNNYSEKIQDGVKWLDENYPNWRDKVDPDTLNIGSDCGCILGQVNKKYTDTLKQHGLSHRQACELGFNVPDDIIDEYFDNDMEDDIDLEYKILTKKWIEVL